MLDKGLKFGEKPVSYTGEDCKNTFVGKTCKTFFSKLTLLEKNIKGAAHSSVDLPLPTILRPLV